MIDGPRLSEASPAANAPAEAETPLSCKHRGQDTTSVTGATPADRYPLYVSGQKAKPLSGCGGWIRHHGGGLVLSFRLILRRVTLLQSTCVMALLRGHPGIW